MHNKINSDPRAFILKTARVYIPGTLPKKVEMTPATSGGGCCGSAPAPSQEETSGCGTSAGCDTNSTAQRRTSCC